MHEVDRDDPRDTNRVESSLRDTLDHTARSLDRTARVIGPRHAVGLFFSAAIFLVCGYLLNWTHERLISGELVPMVVLLKWTFRGAGLLFLACAIAACAGARAAPMAGSIVSIIAALAIGAVAIWDWFTPNLTSGIHAAILALVAIATLYVGVEDLARGRA